VTQFRDSLGEHGADALETAQLRDKLRDRIGYAIASPIDELAAEIAAEVRSGFQRELTQEHRTAFVKDGVARLRARLQGKNGA
jgi:hypothetical protein